MSLNLVVGKSNSGKSEYIMKRIMACNNKQAILFVPSSMRVIAEQEYLKYTNKKGITDVCITSIDRYVDRNLKKSELYKSKEYLPELAKKLLIRKVVLENGDLFEIFAKVKNNQSFIDKLCAYIDSAENQSLCSRDILSKYEEDDFLGRKLKEFGNIYKKVEDTLSDRFVTSVDKVEYYINEIIKEKAFNGYEVFFDGYNNFSKVEYEYIKTILSTGANVTISLEIDLEKHLEGVSEIFATTYETFENLKRIASQIGVKVTEVKLNSLKDNRPKDLEFLGTNIFDLSKAVYDNKVENVKLVLKENTYSELEYIAADILFNIKNGHRYNDIVIYTNDIDSYYTGIRKIFNQHDIPVYLNSCQAIYSTSIVIYIISMLKIISSGLQKDVTPFVSLIKTGLTGFEDTDEFENYIREFGITGYYVEKPFTQNNKSEQNHIYDLDKINLLREQVLDRIYYLKNKLNDAKTTKEITQVIYDHLIESGIIKNYEQDLLLVNKVSINEYNRQVQTVEKLYEIMDNIVLAYDEISLKEYVQLLEYASKEITIDTIPEKTDQVYISDINKNRGTEKKIGYIIGAYDGGLPTIQNEDNIFSDIELKRLKERNIDLKQTKIDRNNMQLFNIYQAINKIREKLIITVPASKMSGGSLRPSQLIQTVKNILNIKLETQPTRTDIHLNANFMSFITRICEYEEIDKKELEKLYNEFLLYVNGDKYKKVLEYLREDNNLNKDTLDLIYGDKINSSVSRLEQFKRCPFAYYSKYILNLKENKEHQVTNLDLGTLMHGVLEEFSKYIVSKNIAWQDIVLNEKIKLVCYKEIDGIVDRIFNENYSKYLISPKYVVLKNKVKNSIKKTIYAISDSFNHSSFRPLGYEIEFEDGELFAPIKIDLDNGKSILLRGKIDRVDSASINGNTYLRIVDYKSSDRDLKITDVRDGINLQLMTYMWAMLENKNKITNSEQVIPAAISYFTISSKLLNIPSCEKDESKIASMLKSALKLRGIYIKDIEILKELDNNYNYTDKSYIAVSSRTLNNDKKVLPEDVFREECINMKKILKEISNDLTNGKVSICPNKKIKDVCKYCKFSAMCRKHILN